MLLLRVAADLDAVGQPWDLEDLAVAACQEHPDEFGLRKYPCYPDFHRVRYLIDGKKGLAGEVGCLRRVGREPERWQVTDVGLTSGTLGRVVRPPRAKRVIQTDRDGKCRHGLPPEYCAPCNGNV